jgi:archaellum component FlaC
LKLYKESVSQAKEKIAQIQGSNQALMERLKTEFGVSTIEDATTLLQTTEEEVGRLETQLKTIVRKIEEHYDFGI